ncbi:MAG: hypothetical protein QFX35_04135 [Candidatus Verstraetearchaeota archaeon]|nr:hypothetical protein [Candidatus Verstraetearchaeota archaeon]
MISDRTGDLVCVECGLVHTLGAAQKPLPGKKQRLGSLISKSSTLFTDAGNRRLRAKEQTKYNRLKRLQESAYNGSCFDMSRIQRDLESIAKDLALPEEAIEITLQFFDSLLSKLKNPYSSYGMLMAVCLASVSRELGERAPVKLSELVEAFKRRGYRISGRVLAKNLSFHSLFIPFKKTFRKSEDYVGRIVEKLRASPYIEVRVRLIGFEPEEYFRSLCDTSRMLLTSLPPPRRSGKNPYLLAASAVFVANEMMARSRSRESIVTKSQFSKDIGIAEYTLRSHLSTIFLHNGASHGGSLVAHA